MLPGSNLVLHKECWKCICGHALGLQAVQERSALESPNPEHEQPLGCDPTSVSCQAHTTQK